jgi:hypothetical protein
LVSSTLLLSLTQTEARNGGDLLTTVMKIIRNKAPFFTVDVHTRVFLTLALALICQSEQKVFLLTIKTGRNKKYREGAREKAFSYQQSLRYSMKI